MFGSSANCVFFLIILLIFISTGVFSDSSRECFDGQRVWYCSYDETCGSSFGDCIDSSSLPPAIIAIIIITSLFCFVMCLSCCLRSQQQQRYRTTYVHSNTQVGATPYQQQGVRRPVRVVRVRPIYNIGAASPVQSFPSTYEAPPPSYEVATANLPTVHQSSSSPPVTATVDHQIY